MPSELDYYDELVRAMHMLSQQSNAIFIGQGVGCAGTSMTDTLKFVPQHKLLELPVAEDMQMGMAIGMALEGMLPICIYPRWNFLLLAANQLINHLDALPLMSEGGYAPKIIIRTAVPSINPFYPGPQHDGDFTDAFDSMLRSVMVVKLHKAEDIHQMYQQALIRSTATLLVEYTDQYRTVVPSGVAGRKYV